MPERNGSGDSFDEFFGASKTDNDGDEKKLKQNGIPKKSAVAALIKSQPIVHHRQPSLETKSNINSKKMPLTTYAKNTPTKSKSTDSPPPKTYESDFDENASADEKKKHDSILPPPPPKQRTPSTPRRLSDSKARISYTIINNNPQRKKFLPYIRTKTRTKRLRKASKNEVEQRVLSAQNEKVIQLESRLAELRRQLEAERMENKTLRLIQKREEKALKQYENLEYDVHQMASDYTHEIEDVKEKIIHEKEIKIKLEKEIVERDETLRDQTKRMKFYEKLVYEPNLHEPDFLREKLEETDRQLKNCQEKIANKEKFIQSLEKKYRHGILQELVKRREIRHKIEDHSKKYTDLLLRFEEKTRQIGTMHIYIQRGGRRPSYTSSINLSKSRSLQSLQDTSPRFREKILEYDKRRRDEEKLKPKPKPKPLIINPPPKPERKKYLPTITQKPKATIISPVPVHDEKPPPPPPPPPPIIETEHLTPKGKPPLRRLSTPISIDEDRSDVEDEIIIETKRPTPPSSSPSPPPQPTPTKIMQRSEQHLSQAPVHKRPLTPISPPPESSSLFKQTEPPATREFDDKWMNIFETNKKEEPTKDDLISKLISDDQPEKKIVTTTKPSPQRPSMIMFEPSSMLTNDNQKKPPKRITTNNVYDFDQTIINLHEGKPVTTPPATTKISVDSFESLFDNNTTKPINRMNGRDDTFTTTQDKSDGFDSIFTQSSNAADTSTTLKPNLRQLPSQNDKLNRPKVVTNAPKPVANRTVVEEIEEFVL